LLINTYRTPVSGVFRRKDFWFRGLWRKPGQRFAVCGGNPAWQQWRRPREMDRGRVLGVRSALLGQRYARLELKGQIGVVVVGWDWGTGEWAKSSTLLSCGAAFGTVL
jgi:hypothetical protein